MSRGGTRSGAGRKPAAASTRGITIRATEATIEKVRFLRRYKVDVNAAFAKMVDEMAGDWGQIDESLERIAAEQRAAANAVVNK